MPTYDYACKNCGHRFEAFQSMTEPVLTTCPRCQQDALQRLIGAGAGLVFKGSGYYLTDYKKSSVPPADNSSRAPETSPSKNGNGSAGKAPSEQATPGTEKKHT